MNVMDKQKILDVLNTLDVVEEGSEGYILVENNVATHQKLNELGVKSETINKYGDDETFCIIALAFTERYANDFENGKLVWKVNKSPNISRKKFVILKENMGDDEGNELFQADIPFEVKFDKIKNLNGFKISVNDIWVDFEVKWSL